MSPSPGARTPTAGSIRSKTHTRFEELEDALRLVRAERRGQLDDIEHELGQLQNIYHRMTTDLESLRAERDHAIEEVRAERERRARETLELSEKLDKALRRTDGEPQSPEGFVRQRLQEAPAEHRALAAGELPTVPGYKVSGPLGQGGMATVYQACAADGREVAIKLLHDGPDASPGRVELFLREAAVMLQLAHPGLVRALDAGDCPHGRFLVLELVRGESLAALVRRTGPLPEKEAIRVALQIARALSYCARLGLTHRDVKPSNLLTDASGRVRLCDFGLAALSYGVDPARPYGSPGYAAPEQISNPTSIDERVDIYALGCTLWHLVVGRRAFQGSPKQVFDLQKTQDLTDPRFEGADVSPRLAQVIRRMGRADRDRRYRRWDECILDLMLVENGNPPFSAHLAEALEPGSPAAAEQDAASIAAGLMARAPSHTATPPAAHPPSAQTSGGVPATGASSAAPATAPSSASAHASASASHPPAGTALVPPPARLLVPPARQASPLPAGPRAGGISRDDVLPAAPRALRAHAPWALVFAACVLGSAFGYGVSQLSQPTAVQEIETRARRLAASGDARGAAEALRASAALLDGPDRDRLLALADALAKSPPK